MDNYIPKIKNAKITPKDEKMQDQEQFHNYIQSPIHKKKEREGTLVTFPNQKS
jgi:hypothetical protein